MLLALRSVQPRPRAVLPGRPAPDAELARRLLPGQRVYVRHHTVGSAWGVRSGGPTRSAPGDLGALRAAACGTRPAGARDRPRPRTVTRQSQSATGQWTTSVVVTRRVRPTPDRCRQSTCPSPAVAAPHDARAAAVVTCRLGGPQLVGMSGRAGRGRGRVARCPAGRAGRGVPGRAGDRTRRPAPARGPLPAVGPGHATCPERVDRGRARPSRGLVGRGRGRGTCGRDPAAVARPPGRGVRRRTRPSGSRSPSTSAGRSTPTRSCRS